MKNSRIIKIYDDYVVRITVKETGDNYNQFVSIFFKDEKLPLFGTCFKNTDTNMKIKNWAEERINASYNLGKYTRKN